MKTIIKCGWLFDATTEDAKKNQVIIIEDKMIQSIIDLDALEETQQDSANVIDLSNQFVMPGLIDAHVHVCLDGSPTTDGAYHMLPGEVTLNAMVLAQKDLMAGFTTLRDEGGLHLSDIALKNAINAGLVDGPRLIVSGTALTATGGHGDSHFSPNVTNASVGLIVDSPDEARKAARYNLKYGADQIKLFATGGVMSFGDEPGASELTYEEMKAALDVAKSKGKISSAHAHGAEGIKNAVRAGITSIEHGMLIDEEAMDMMKDYGVYLIPTIIAAYEIVEKGKEGLLPDWMVIKAQECLDNHGDNLRKMIQKGVKIGFGTDAGTAFNIHGQQAYEFDLMTQYGFTPAQSLLAATKVNSELIKLQDQIGTLEAGKLADIVAFDGNVLEDISLMKSCAFVMKEGKIYKQA